MNCKIIYISNIIIEANTEEKLIWEKYKVQMMEDFSLIDSKIFWEKFYIKEINELEKYLLYKKFKLLLRFEIIKNIKVMFDKNLHLIGDDWNLFSINSFPSNYSVQQIKKLYEGNICLDLGSMLGSVSLYSRSNQIIESGGLIIQSYQSDADEIWGDLKDKILFKNLSDLTSLINKLLADKKYCFTLLQEISENFRHSDKSIEKSLDKIFNILN